jgi:hypothetical protein
VFSTPRETVPGPVAYEIAFHSYLQSTVVRNSSAIVDGYI